MPRISTQPVVIVSKRSTYIPHLLAVAFLWALAMALDYHDQAAAEKERAESMTRQMAECMNGEWRGTAADGTRVGCMKAETLHPSQVSHHTKE